MSDTVKRKRISGKKLTLIIIGGFLAALILAVGIFYGVASCASSKKVIPELKQGFTVRKVAPVDGSTPADHSGLDNIAYMAYVLDNQDYYHAYANNSTKSTGYEQVTQTWKDYKSKDASGYGSSIMVCSDLSYSSLIKSASQTCFVGSEDAYMRTGNKPAKNTVPTEIVWSTEQPTHFTDKSYLNKYGEFSTELSVYVINDDTVEGFDEVVDNGDGTFTQKFYLKEDAAVWYRNGMKTRGSLKTLPTFEKIEISFTFDSKWQVLSSYCEEKASISPSALGGIAMGSTSKTTTTYSYGEEEFDGVHYDYFENYFRDYVGKDITNEPGKTPAPTILDVLGSAFSGVIDPNGNGQQFTLELTLGGTEYIGRAYAKVSNLEDIVGSLDIRIDLEKKGSGKQDLYIEFSNGAVNVYYSDSFALVADISAVAQQVTAITEWVNNLKPTTKAEEVAYALSGEAEEGGLDLSSLLAAVKFDYNDTSAYIAIDSDDLLGLGIGIKAQMNFTRTMADDGDTYSFIDLSLDTLTYENTPVDLGISMLPSDRTEIISRNENDASASLADYIGGISGLLNSNVYLVELNLDGTSEIEYISGVALNVAAKLKLEKDEESNNIISVQVPIFVSYNKLSVNLEAFYTINLGNGDLGEVYLNLAEINGEAYGLKVYGNIEETVEAVKELIALINSEEGDGNGSDEEVQLLSEEGEPEEANTVANIINAVLNINYAKVVKELIANQTQISVTLDADEILNAFNYGQEGITLGDLTLTLTNGEKASLSGSLSGLGLSVAISGSDNEEDDITVPEKGEYIDIIEVVDTVRAAVVEAQKIINGKDTEFTIDATLTVDGVVMQVKGFGEASWTDDKIRFAVSLEMTIADTVKEEFNSETVYVNFVYDETEGAPVARFTVNKLGLEITEENISEVSNLFTDIMNAVNGLIGNGANAAYLSEVSEEEGVETVEPNVPAIDYTKILGTALDLISKITVELQNPSIEEGGVKNLVITYAGNGFLTLGANGGLSLDLTIADDESIEILSLNASVTAGGGSKIDAINSIMDGVDENGEKIYTFYTADTFIKAVYDYVLDLLDDLTVKNLLGSNTYTVEVAINGSESGIPELDGIIVNANLYYTETDDEGAKLMEADIDLDINGTAVKAKAYYTDRALYISLEKVGETELEDIAFKAELDNIYGAAKTLVELITSEAFAEIIATIGGGQVQALSLDEPELDGTENGTESGATSTSLTAILNYILTLDVNSVIKFEKIMADDTVQNTLTVNPDGILEALGVNVKVGTAYVAVNPETHTIYASVTYEGSDWLILNAVAVEESSHGTFDKEKADKFIDINFVATLLEDVKISLEAMKPEGEDADVRLSFTGDISIDMAGAITINITNSTVTVGFDENNEFYFSLYGHLENAKLLVDIAKASQVSITYSKGYITMGRDVDAFAPKYRVLTLEYLLDNLLDKNNSPLFWWLSTADVGGLLERFVNVNISSGLTSTEDFYLYDNSANEPQPEPEVPEDKPFRLSDILLGLSVKNGEYTSGYGNAAGVDSQLNSKFSLTDNYYAFNLDLNSLMGDTIQNLYAAIVRNENGGLKGLDAYAEIASQIKLNAKLDKGLTTDHAKNYFTPASAGIDFDYYKDYEYKIFGCYDTQTKQYYASDINHPVTLKVYGFEEGKEYGKNELGDKEVLTKTINTGSTVYLFEEEQWLDDEHTLKLVYIDGNGNDLGLSFVITGDIEIYLTKVGGKSITFHNPYEEDRTGEIFVGGILPDPATTETDGKTFAGWYTDEGLTKLTAVVTVGAEHYYAKYIDSTYTADNGVIYTFTKDSTLNAGGYYTVSGTTDVSAYTDYGTWLTLDNEHDGYPVTTVGKSALAKKGLKNIILPENISYICENAFSDNNDIRNVVFYAPVVKLEGTKEGKTYPFYGCTVGDNSNNTDGQTTNLNVYYRTIVAVSGEEYADGEVGVFCWQHVRTFNGGLFNATKYYRFIQNNPASEGSKLYAAGTWAYVEYETEDEDLTGFDWFVNGLNYAGLSQDEIKDLIISSFNEITKLNGYINAYDVEVSEGFNLDGRYYKINIKVTENLQSALYQLTIETNYSGNKVDYIIESEEETVLISETETSVSYYVSAGTQITLDAVAADNGVYSFDGWLGAEAENETHVAISMPLNALDIKAIWEASTNDNIYVISEIAFTYNNVEQAAGGDYLKKAIVNDNLTAPQAEGYIFLGWAQYDEVKGLYIAENTLIGAETEATYYALWVAVSDYVSFELEGLTLTATLNENCEGEFHGWYTGAGEGFTGNVLSDATAYTFTKDNTSLRARVKFTLTVDVLGQHTDGGTFTKAVVIAKIGNSEEKTTADSAGKNTTVTAKNHNDYVILEGETLYVKIIDTHKDCWIYTDSDSNLTGQIGVKGGTNVSASAQELKTVTNDAGLEILSDGGQQVTESNKNYYLYSLTVSGNYSFKYQNF